MPEIDNKTLDDVYDFLTELLGEWNWKNNSGYKKFQDDYNELVALIKEVGKFIK